LTNKYTILSSFFHYFLPDMKLRVWLSFAAVAVFVLCAGFDLAAQTTSIIPISQARMRPLGAMVSVAGRVTVANDFGGPSYFQDATGGLAVFDTTFHRSVTIGDSVEIMGPLSEFQATTGQAGTGLLQISGAGTTFRVVTGANITRIIQTPREITAAQVIESVEGQLIRLSNVNYVAAGALMTVFQGNTNYVIRESGSTTNAAAQVRIGARTNLVGVRIPPGNQSVVGVLSQFRGTYQILPRNAADLGLQVTVNPGDTVPKSRTFNVTTWNLKWFGLPNSASGERLGPADSLLQLRNVIRVIDSVDADVYGLQEVSNLPLFRQITDSLPRYGYAIASFNQSQRTAFLFKRSAVDTSASALLLTGTNFATGRLPFQMNFSIRKNNAGRSFAGIVIHAKAGATDRDYQLRSSDARALVSLLSMRQTDGSGRNTLVAGDFNDDLTTSIVGGLPSPYVPFVQSGSFFAPTLTLAQQGLTSFSGGSSLIDHIVVSSSMRDAVFAGAEKVENPFYIPSYTSTTSDHFPVSVRFFAERIPATTVSTQALRLAKAATLSPNPASELTTLPLTLSTPTMVNVQLVNALGSVVASASYGMLNAGVTPLVLSVAELPAGLYWCRVYVGDAVQSLPLLVSR
jgi:endonuclease/exonuclease/phosphatase family metal-dependent hydrolase